MHGWGGCGQGVPDAAVGWWDACLGMVGCMPRQREATPVDGNVDVSGLLAISGKHVDVSGEPGPHAKGVNHPQTTR